MAPQRATFERQAGIFGEIMASRTATSEYLSLLPRFKTGSRPGGNGPSNGHLRALGRAEDGYLVWALQKFSGYIAADEVYEGGRSRGHGPFCVLSVVDNHSFNRLFYEVLDHSPSQADVIAFPKAMAAQRAGPSAFNASKAT